MIEIDIVNGSKGINLNINKGHNIFFGFFWHKIALRYSLLSNTLIIYIFKVTPK